MMVNIQCILWEKKILEPASSVQLIVGANMDQVIISRDMNVIISMTCFVSHVLIYQPMPCGDLMNLHTTVILSAYLISNLIKYFALQIAQNRGFNACFSVILG